MFKVGDKVRLLRKKIHNVQGIDINSVYTVIAAYEYCDSMYLANMFGSWSMSKFELVSRKIIDKVGFYKSKDGRKIEITSIKENKAVGWFDTIPLIYNTLTGQHINTDNLDIVSEWKDPIKVNGVVYVGKQDQLGQIYISTNKPNIVLAEQSVSFEVNE